MSQQEQFVARLHERTRAHLEELAVESGALFAEFASLPEIGQAVYARLVEYYNMDGAQEIAGLLVALFGGDIDDGTVAVSERAFRGISSVFDEFYAELPHPYRTQLKELIEILSRADT